MGTVLIYVVVDLRLQIRLSSFTLSLLGADVGQHLSNCYLDNTSLPNTSTSFC